MTPIEITQASGPTLDAALRRSMRLHGDRLALIGGGRTWTYRELDAETDRIGGGLVASGLRAGSRIAVLSEPRPEYAHLLVSAAKTGICLVGLNTRFHQRELAYCIDDSGPAIVFCSATTAGLATEAVAEASHSTLLVNLDQGGLARYSASGGPWVVSPEDGHVVVYTSGTTGLPKGALISQRASATRAFRIAGAFGTVPEDRFGGWLPMFHTGAVESLNTFLVSGAAYCVTPSAAPEDLCRMVERHRVTMLPLMPGMFNEYYDHRMANDYDLSCLRQSMGIGDQLPPDRLDALMTRDGFVYVDIFGQTETSFLIACNTIRPGAVDTTFPKVVVPLMDVRLVDDFGDPVPAGVPGECVVRAATVMSGYLNAPEQTAETFAGGWLHTGDILTRDAEGYLRFTDRKKYLIKTGGENVYPAEVERALSSHPDVVEVCVVGTKDDTWGEAVRAFVVARTGAEVSGRELSEWCRREIGGFKRPRYVRFISRGELPVTPTGKIMKGELEIRPVLDEERVD